MEKLFGLEMATIAGVLSAILALVVLSLALLAWRRPVFFKLGLRPIPRRQAQSTLIVLGLMLATLIITAAFVTAGVMRLVAPVWSFGPHAEAGTSVLQSDWAKAAEPNASTTRAATTATIALGFIADSFFSVRGHAARRGLDAGAS